MRASLSSGRRAGSPVALREPPSSNTGAEITLSLHWLRGTVLDRPWLDVVGSLASMLDETPVGLDRGRNGYRSGWLIGPARVYADDDRPDMGVMVDIDGSGCEALGGRRLADIALRLDLRVSRLDLAWDGFPRSPAEVRDAWRADMVRTRCKVPEDAREDRQWRTSDWHSNDKGDTFRMGARSSTQCARVYDARGPVRFELEVKGALAATAAPQLLEALEAGDELRFADLAVGLARRFVDFVDAEGVSNRARAPLLSWWESFVGAARRAAVTLPGVVQRSVAEIEQWIERQVAPSLALLDAVYGTRRLEEIAAAGRGRWTGRHRAAFALSRPGLSPG